MVITGMVVPTDGYGQRIFSDTITEPEDYTFVCEQNYIKLTNTSNVDIEVNVGEFTNKTLHGQQTLEVFTDFETFNVSVPEEVTINIETREYEDKDVKKKALWALNIMQNASGGDMVLSGDPVGTSAGTANAGIVADGYYDVEFAFKVATTADATHTWFNGRLNTTVDVTSTSGLAEAVSCTVTEGVGTAMVRYTGEFAEADTVELTIKGGTFLGYTVADVTITDTLIA